MSTTVTYKGNTLTTVNNNTKILNTAGKYLEGDISLTDVTTIATLITKSITANGTYNASSDSADGYSSVTVNVGGGGSNWTLLATETYNLNITNTTASKTGDIYLNTTLTAEDIIWVHIRDTNGKRNGYWYGSDSLYLLYQLKNGSTNNATSLAKYTLYVSSGNYSQSINAYGLYLYSLYDSTTSNPYVRIYQRYNSAYGTMNGSYKCDIYKLTPATGMKIFD